MDRSLTTVLVDAIAAHAPRPAAFAGDQMVRYQDLGARAASMAAALRSVGIGPGHRVGIWMEKSLDALQAILGTLLAGATYVPLDAKAPRQRVCHIVRDCDLSALAIDGLHTKDLGHVLAVAPNLRAVFGTDAAAPDGCTAPWMSLSTLASASPERLTTPDVAAESPAYILYTSGSTGRPKGVVISHRAALGFVDWCVDTFAPVPDDRISSHAPFHFDLSIFDLYATFASGASVRLLRPTETILARWLAEKIPEWGITVWYSVPSALVAMLEHLPPTGAWPDMRLILFAGEVFPTPHLRQLQRALRHVRLANLYGPTETNVCTWYDVEPIADEQNAPIPIGTVCSHLSGAILDDQRREVAHGAEGDLWIGGANLLSGYWNDAALTRSKLIDDPRPGHGGVLYNTGDRVRLDERGQLIFLGRRDHMVKVRGYRIDLGDVESAFYEHPGVSEVAAIAVPDDAQGHRVHAFVALRADARVGVAELRSHLRLELPAYMIPSEIEVVTALPRTSTGKIDRLTLQARSPDANEVGHLPAETASTTL